VHEPDTMPIRRLAQFAKTLSASETGDMSRAYSNDLRYRIVRAVEEEGMPLSETAARFAVGVANVKRYLRQWRTTGDLTPRSRSGRPRAIPPEAHDRFVAMLAADPDTTLDVYRTPWEAETGVVGTRGGAHPRGTGGGDCGGTRRNHGDRCCTLVHRLRLSSAQGSVVMQSALGAR